MIGSSHAFVEEPRAIEALTSFKTAVDELRRFLWFYIEELSKNNGMNADIAMQAHRMRRATEMLRILAEKASSADVTHLPEAKSFLESVQSIVDLHVNQ